MARGSKKKYTSQQKRKAHDIEKDYKKRGTSSKEAERRAWAAEKVGRARLMIAGDEPGSLGLVLTLEGLVMGVTGKKLLWRTLAASKLPRLNGYDFEELQRHAEQQISRIEAERMRAVGQAFAGAIDSR